MSSPEQPTIISTRVIVEHGPDIALLRRASTGEFAGAWELPGGKVEPGEDIAAGARRETEEEMGISIDLLPFQPEMIDNRPILDGKHRGKWYKAYGFIAAAASRDLTLDPEEHEDSIWIPPYEALALATLSQTSRKAILELGALCSSQIKKPSTREGFVIS